MPAGRPLRLAEDHRARRDADTARHEDGQVVVEGPAHGDFTGSPIRFTYRFTLVNDAITALEITA